MPDPLIKDGHGVTLVTIKVTPLQAAFLEWCRHHPYSRIKELKIHEGVPLEARIATDDNFGEEVVRFDRIAKESGLID